MAGDSQPMERIRLVWAWRVVCVSAESGDRLRVELAVAADGDVGRGGAAVATALAARATVAGARAGGGLRPGAVQGRAGGWGSVPAKEMEREKTANQNISGAFRKETR